MAIKLYNTLTRKKEEFKPIKNRKVGFYACGPTVYDYDHLGHAWNYTVADILRRVLEYNDYKVKHIINITDVGHLTSDADTGEDKMEKSAKEKKKTVWEVAKYFTKIYLENRKKINLLEPKLFPKATDHIPEMINLIKILIKKGYAYKISDGIYFRVTKFPPYGQLSGNALEKLKAGARIEINPEKEHPADFALWKFSPKNTKRQMEWPSPWGIGFPGWHIECSAMSMKYLGESFDIHSGGEDNIFPHHESEIAQSEAVSGKKFVLYWVHTKFLTVEGEKMSKSLKNFYRIEDIEKMGYRPLALRYLFLTSHYRSQMNFTWQGLKSAQIALNKLYESIANYNKKGDLSPFAKATGEISKEYQEKFLKAINNDLNMPKALAVVWQLIKSPLVGEDKKATLLEFDKVLGLGLKKVKKIKIPEKIKKLVQKREKARQEKNWILADKIRQEIKKIGYSIEDTSKGPIIKIFNF